MAFYECEEFFDCGFAKYYDIVEFTVYTVFPLVIIMLISMRKAPKKEIILTKTNDFDEQ
ncbi:MAG: hypothetical protein AMXMBFR48_10030 [Ignavibacteriales bacterium]